MTIERKKETPKGMHCTASVDETGEILQVKI